MTTRTTAALALVGVLALAGCSDSGSDGGSDEGNEPSPTEVLSEAGTTLAETSGVHLDLHTDNLPDGVTGITKADGIATNAPAFDGTINVIYAGQSVDVPVIAVDGKVFAQLPFTEGWSDVDPSEYGAPDPASLVDADTGFSSLLAQTEKPEAGESERGGENNTEVLTTYSGTVPGKAMKQVIPSATGDSFEAEYLITDENELRQATLTGEFYPGSGSMTYTVDFDDYGSEQDITAP